MYIPLDGNGNLLRQRSQILNLLERAAQKLVLKWMQV